MHIEEHIKAYFIAKFNQSGDKRWLESIPKDVK